MKKLTRLSVNEYVQGIKGNNLRILSKAITLVESTTLPDQELSRKVLSQLKLSIDAIRIGITGSPGVGKSTFIESFTKALLKQKKKVAILTIDPSSPHSGGSILGDKTRMESISREPNVFIRSSPSGNDLGGLNQASRESMLLCEAAGYDIIIIETVGVGQSETDIRLLCDHFLLLQQPGAGDDIQGMKKGVIELADILIINKADGDLKQLAQITKTQLDIAIGTLLGSQPIETILCSSINNLGIEDVIQTIYSKHQKLTNTSELENIRTNQKIEWFYKRLKRIIFENFINSNQTGVKLAEIKKKLSSIDYDVHDALDEILKDND